LDSEGEAKAGVPLGHFDVSSPGFGELVLFPRRREFRSLGADVADFFGARVSLSTPDDNNFDARAKSA
jgi:hypothetical protein